MPHLNPLSRLAAHARPSVLSASLLAAGVTVSSMAIAPSHAALPERPAAAASDGRSTEVRGTLPGGGRYVLHEPAQWNRTVLMWNPGNAAEPAGFVALTAGAARLAESKPTSQGVL